MPEAEANFYPYVFTSGLFFKPLIQSLHLRRNPVAYRDLKTQLFSHALI